MTVTVTQETIDPSLATKILEKSKFKNRKINQSNLDRHIRRMVRGEFLGLLNGPIVITAKGELIDGQHRLTAIIESNTTQQLMVARGADVDSYIMLDNGTKPKTNNDILSSIGFQYSSLKAGAANHFKKFESYAADGKLTSPKLMASEIEEIINDYGDPKLNYLCKQVDKLSKWPRMAPVPTLGILMYAMKDATDFAVLDEFVEGASASKNIYDGDPRFLLQKFCSQRQGHSRDKEIFYIMCWNMWVTGGSRKNLFKVDGKTKYPKVLLASDYVAR